MHSILRYLNISIRLDDDRMRLSGWVQLQINQLMPLNARSVFYCFHSGADLSVQSFCSFITHKIKWHHNDAVVYHSHNMDKNSSKQRPPLCHGCQLVLFHLFRSSMWCWVWFWFKHLKKKKTKLPTIDNSAHLLEAQLILVKFTFKFS